MKIQALMVAALLAPATVLAAEPNDDLRYTYFEGRYLNLDIDTLDDSDDVIADLDDGGGWGVEGAFAFTRMFFAYAGYSVTDADATFSDGDTFIIPANTDIKRLDVGLGLVFPLQMGTHSADLVTRAGYIDVDFDDFDFGGSDGGGLDDLNDDSSDGWTADAQLRAQLTPWLEGSVGVGYIDIEDLDSFSALASFLFEMSPNWGINAAANIGDEVSTYSLGVRYSFDRF